MKSLQFYLLCILLMAVYGQLGAQNWTLIKGTSFGGASVYSSNAPASDSVNYNPGSRSMAATWFCNGRYYLFGAGGNDLWE